MSKHKSALQYVMTFGLLSAAGAIIYNIGHIVTLIFMPPLIATLCLSLLVILVFFCGLVSHRLITHGSVLPSTMYIAGLIALASLTIGLFYMIGVVKDLAGVYCTGLFGSKDSCTLGIKMIFSVMIINPFVIAVFGGLALSGLIAEHVATKK